MVLKDKFAAKMITCEKQTSYLLAILLATSCQQKTEHFEYEALKGQWESEERIANANVVLHFGNSIIEFDPYIGDTIMMLFNPVIQNDTLMEVSFLL